MPVKPLAAEDARYRDDMIDWLKLLKTFTVPQVARVQGIPTAMARRIVTDLVSSGRAVVASENAVGRYGATGTKYRMV